MKDPDIYRESGMELRDFDEQGADGETGLAIAALHYAAELLEKTPERTSMPVRWRDPLTTVKQEASHVAAAAALRKLARKVIDEANSEPDRYSSGAWV